MIKHVASVRGRFCCIAFRAGMSFPAICHLATCRSATYSSTGLLHCQVCFRVLHCFKAMAPIGFQDSQTFALPAKCFRGVACSQDNPVHMRDE
jgi:hypothetical protein